MFGLPLEGSQRSTRCENHAMQVKPQLSDRLITFALATIGPYPTRYDKILEEAFSQHKIMLSAHLLRQLAGGGSNTTAQEAVERFKTKLHETLSNRIEFGADIPTEVAQSMNRTLSDLWIYCLKVSTEEFNQDRLKLQEVATAAIEAERLATQQTQAIQQASISKIQALESDVEALSDASGALVDSIANERSKSNKLEVDMSILNSALTQSGIEISRLEKQSGDLNLKLIALNASCVRDIDTQKNEFRLQLSEVKRERTEAINLLEREINSLRAADAAERRSHVETTLKCARVEQQLFQVSTSNAALDLQLNKEKLESESLRLESNRLNGCLAELTAKLNMHESLEEQVKNQMVMLENIQMKLNKSNDKENKKL